MIMQYLDGRSWWRRTGWSNKKTDSRQCEERNILKAFQNYLSRIIELLLIEWENEVKQFSPLNYLGEIKLAEGPSNRVICWGKTWFIRAVPIGVNFFEFHKTWNESKETILYAYNWLPTTERGHRSALHHVHELVYANKASASVELRRRNVHVQVDGPKFMDVADPFFRTLSVVTEREDERPWT